MPFSVSEKLPAGNVADVHIFRAGPTAVIEFSAHPHEGIEALWFCFRATPVDASFNGPLELVLNHVESLLAGLQPGVCTNLRPVIRTEKSDWTRLGPGVERRSPDGRYQAVWRMDENPGSFDLAICYPYGPAELTRLVQKNSAWMDTATIGVSQCGRPLLRLANQPGVNEGKIPGFYILARQHAGETPGSWVLDGLLSAWPDAVKQDNLLWVIPICDIDGVARGDYGKDRFPHDLARAWGNPAMRHETLVYQRNMRLWASRCSPKLVLDLHSPGPGETDGVYCFTHWGPQPQKPGQAANTAVALSTQTPDPAAAQAAEQQAKLRQQFADLFAQELADFGAERFARAATHASRWMEHGTLKSFCDTALNTPSLTFEIPYATARGKLLTTVQYREIGRRMAAAMGRMV